jgi:predicted acylesterase/phospholipase RssA
VFGRCQGYAGPVLPEGFIRSPTLNRKGVAGLPPSSPNYLSPMRLAAAVLALVVAVEQASGQTCPAGPTALVLSGGGAKGLAHIGVLEAMDSLRIRPDIIVGSSMGAIVGGLYASGYSAREIDSLARHLPLTRLFRTYEPHIPISLGLLQPAIVWEQEAGGLVFQRAAVLESEVNALLNAGFLRGNLMARGNFDSLPIPFRAVATDLLSGDPYVLATGDLAQAVRASAAIPLLFKPEKLAGRYLGDGGLSANVPIAVARREGAVRIIVSYTTERMPDSLNLQSTLVLIDHLIGNLFRQPAESLGSGDVPIRPDVEGFRSLNFSTSAVRVLIDRGFEAAATGLDSAPCLPRRGDPLRPVSDWPVLEEFTVESAAPGDSVILRRMLELTPGRAIDVPALQRNLRQMGTSERYSSVWLFPQGNRDSVRFTLTPSLAPSRMVAIGAAYDNDMGGRIWLGQVNRHLFGTNLELSTGVFLGELRQDITSGWRIRPPGTPGITPVLELRATRELVRRFNDGDELTPTKVHEGTAFAGINAAWRGNWHATLGLQGRIWDVPRSRGRGAAGPRLSLLKAGRMAEPLLSLDAEVNGVYQRLEVEGVATVRLGQWQIRPHVRYGVGDSLPSQHRFVFGGIDGFAGRHIGELRSDRELMGSLAFLHPLVGQLMVRVEPMVGAIGGDSGWLPGGETFVGVRMGLNLFTGLGPMRVEYGISDGGRDGLLVRFGRWF